MQTIDEKVNLSLKSLDNLRAESSDVETEDEAAVIVRTLESVLNKNYAFLSLSAPKLGVYKKVAIIRTPTLELNLINPVIVDANDKVISIQERCLAFPKDVFNCFRFNNIIIENGFNKNKIKISGIDAHIVQHEIEHLNGKIFHDSTIKIALLRNGGIIKSTDYCPCNSRKRFFECCSKIKVY